MTLNNDSVRGYDVPVTIRSSSLNEMRRCLGGFEESDEDSSTPSPDRSANSSWYALK